MRSPRMATQNQSQVTVLHYFTSLEYKEIVKSWGVKANLAWTVTEYWPQANKQVERFSQVLLKHVLTSNVEKKGWRQTLPKMLRN